MDVTILVMAEVGIIFALKFSRADGLANRRRYEIEGWVRICYL
jgi:hypothetical protein